MKKLIYLISFVSLTLTSCSNDDTANSLAINSQNLLGKWYIKGGTINNGTFENYAHECASIKDFQEFFSNGELTFNGYNGSCSLSDFEKSMWELNGTTLTVSNTNGSSIVYEYEYNIESLSLNELILKQTVNEPNGMVTYRTTLTRN